ncbi:MAG: hypothetical protein WD830_09340 [Chloroflexota bacterium]
MKEPGAEQPSALTLDEIEERLLRLADRIPSPLKAETANALLGSILGDRIVLLYRGVLHALTGPSAITALHHARAVVEAAILIKWMALDVDTNAPLWFGQAEEEDVRMIRQTAAHLPAPLDERLRIENMTHVLEEKESIAAEGRTAAMAAGRNYGDRVMPTLARMVEEIETAIPEHSWAIRQAYDMLYRFLSPYSHTSAASFKPSLIDRADGDAVYDPNGSPMPERHLRMVTAPSVAYAYEAVGDLLGDTRMTVAARILRDLAIDLPG